MVRISKYLASFVSIAMITAVLTLSTPIESVYAAADTNLELDNELTSTNSIARGEETEWHIKQFGSEWYKRLWSVTYGYWKTEWIQIT